MNDHQADAATYRSPFPTSADAQAQPPKSALSRLLAFDRQRPGIPGEHLMTAALGGWLIKSARRRRTPIAMVLSLLAGGLLLARSASGRDGLARVTRGR